MWSDQPPPRIQHLLDARPPTGFERTWYPNGADERAVLLWEYFTDHEDEPLPLRHARGLRHVLANVRIAIHDDELLIGEVGLDDPAETRPDDLDRAREYWGERAWELQSEVDFPAAYPAMAHGLYHGGAGRNGHTIPAFDVLLTDGLDALRDRAGEGTPQRDAMAEAVGAASMYVERHAALAREMGRDDIADICEWVAHEPPRTFHGALQLLWFAHLAIKMDDGGIGHSIGRFDQYLWPFYSRDLERGRITRDDAAELVACFWIKLNAECDDIAHLSLGGQHPDGSDAANDLSVLCLQVERWIGRKQPNLSTRIHANTSDDYWREIARTISCGAGHPAVFNDDIIVPGLVDHGFDVETARGYAQVGCVETYLPGLAAPWIDCYVNLAKCLELALNAGRDLYDNAQLGPVTDAQFADFDAIYEAFESQLARAVHSALARRDAYDAHVSNHAPVPFISALTPACLERGLDAVEGAEFILTGAYAVGLATTVDSLVAIRSLVYEEGLLDLDRLLAALATDFTRDSETLALCGNRAPKYGNDDDAADDIARRVIDSYGRVMRAYESPSPKQVHYGMIGSVVSHAVMGQRTSATPNGRRAGESLSDGGSPSQGCNVSGATATLNSLAKPNYRAVPGGAAINLRLTPSDIAGDDGLARLVALLKGYFQMGGEQLQVSEIGRAHV